MRQTDFHDLRAELFTVFDRVADGFLNFRIHALDKIFLRQTELHSLETVVICQHFCQALRSLPRNSGASLATLGSKVRNGQIDRSGIHFVFTGHCFQQNGGILDRLGDRADLIKR